jgi:hypothetical protein
MDYVIAGNIINDKNSIDVDYEIYDIQKKKERFGVLRYLGCRINSGS